MADHAGAAGARALFGDAFFKETVKLLVELSKELEFGGYLKQQCEVFLVLLTEIVCFTDDEILMLPDEGGLLLFAHATSTLSLLLGCLARTPPTLLAAFVALTFEAVFDGAHPVQDELIDVLDDVKDTQLMLDVNPVALQSVFVERRAIGNDHPGIESAIFEGV